MKQKPTQDDIPVALQFCSNRPVFHRTLTDGAWVRLVRSFLASESPAELSYRACHRTPLWARRRRGPALASAPAGDVRDWPARSSPPAPPSAGPADCPGSHWSEIGTDRLRLERSGWNLGAGWERPRVGWPPEIATCRCCQTELPVRKAHPRCQQGSFRKENELALQAEAQPGQSTQELNSKGGSANGINQPFNPTHTPKGDHQHIRR